MKTAILLSGHMRSFERCLPTIHWHVARHFPGADWFVSTVKDADSPKADLLRVKYPDARVEIEVIDEQPDCVAEMRAKGVNLPAEWSRGKHYTHEPYAISVHPQAVLRQLWQLERCWQMFEEKRGANRVPCLSDGREVHPTSYRGFVNQNVWRWAKFQREWVRWTPNAGYDPTLWSDVCADGEKPTEAPEALRPRAVEYDVIIRCRPDLWFHSCDPLMLLDPREALIPWWGSFGGCNDRFAILGAESAPFYFATYAHTPRLMEAGCPLHPESLVAASLDSAQAAIRPLFTEFSTLRTNGEMRGPEISTIDLARVRA